jgi:hypothetical protein
MPIGKVSIVRDALKGSWVYFPNGEEVGLIEVGGSNAVISNYTGIIYAIPEPIIEPRLSSFKRTPSTLPAAAALVCAGDEHWISFVLENGDKYFADLKTGIGASISGSYAWFSQWDLYYKRAGKFEELLSVSL